MAFPAVLVVGGTMLALERQCSAEDYSKRAKITSPDREVLGYVYKPCDTCKVQITDDRRNIIGYVERDGTVTDNRRARVGKIGELLGGD